MDAATLAIIQADRPEELHCNLMALAVKLGLVLLGCVSIVRLSGAYQRRLDRHSEIDAVVTVGRPSCNRFNSGSTGCSASAAKNVCSESRKWIAPNRVRIIWR